MYLTISPEGEDEVVLPLYKSTRVLISKARVTLEDSSEEIDVAAQNTRALSEGLDELFIYHTVTECTIRIPLLEKYEVSLTSEE